MTVGYPGDRGDPDDIAIIAVFLGRHTDVYVPSLDTGEYERSVISEEDRDDDM